MESQSLAGGSEPTVDVQWSSSYNLGNYSADDTCDGQFRFTLHYAGAVTEDPTVEDLIGSLSIDSALPDSRATWHRNYTPLAPWIRAHVLKQAMGWNGEKQLADHFEEHPELAVAYGFVGSEPMAQRKTVRPNPPAQARLWEMWHEEFGDKLQTLCRTIAAELVELAREAGIPAPDDVSQPDGKQAASKRSETRLIADTTKKSGSMRTRSSPRNSS